MKTILCMLAFLTLFAGGCKNKKAAHESMPTPEILVKKPLKQDVTYTYQYPAYLQAEQTVNLVARTPGFLEEIRFTPGDEVKAGQLLFVIEPQPYMDQVNSAKAGLESAKAGLAYAKASYEKMKDAVNSRAVSEIDYIQSESSYHNAQATLQNAQAQLNNAENNLDYCYIKAPFNGRITRNLADISNYVGSAAAPTTLATIYKDQQMYVYFNMAYSEYQHLPLPNASKKSKTDSIRISDASTPGKSWSGILDYTSPDVDLKTGTVNIRAIVKNPQHELLSGMYVKITVPYKIVPDGLLVPEASVGTNQSGRFMYVVGKDNTVVFRPVKVGVLESDGMREIVDGLSPDESYIVNAMMSVRPGMKIKPIDK